MAYIDTSKITIPKGFFEDLNTPKLLDWLNSQPTVDVVEVRHGEWKAKFHNSVSGRGRNTHYATFKCSECQKWNGTHRQNYCPSCGAKMDGGKNETL